MRSRRFFSRHGLSLVLGVLLAVTAVWGIRSWSAEKALRRSLQAQYAGAFYELVTGVNAMEVSLSKVLVSASPARSIAYLSDVGRQAQACTTNLAMLPVSHPVLAKTMKFLNQVGDYCQTLEKQAGENVPLGSTNLDQLIDLHNICISLARELNAMATEGVEFTPQDPAQWLEEPSEPGRLADLGVDENGQSLYPTLIFDGPFSDGLEQMTPQGLSGDNITQQQAVAIAAGMLGVPASQVSVETFCRGKINGYQLAAVDSKGATVRLLLTERGGRLQWSMEEADAQPGSVTPEQCVMAARDQMTRLGYTDLAVTWVQQYDNLQVINFAALQDDIVCYPDLIKVRVRQDTGTVCGVDATGWLMNHHERDVPAGIISREEARSMVSSQLAVDQVRLAFIPTGGGGERLCWEFRGEFGGDTFFVYIDATNGQEAQIFRVVNTDRGNLIV